MRCGSKVKAIRTSEKVSAFGIVGRWQDKLIYRDGKVVILPKLSFNWGCNQIQNTFRTLLACWTRAEPGYSRIGFLGIGSGLPGWDSTPPVQSYDQVLLESEYYRLTIPQGDVIFIDPLSGSPSGSPTNKVEITVNIGYSEANGTMREFGLFGGTATSSLDSGEMVNWIVHERIDKTSGFEIQRKIRIEFVKI
jgi:hypothetical protein